MDMGVARVLAELPDREATAERQPAGCRRRVMSSTVAERGKPEMSGMPPGGACELAAASGGSRGHIGRPPPLAFVAECQRGARPLLAFVPEVVDPQVSPPELASGWQLWCSRRLW